MEATTTFGLDAIDISFLQLLATIIGGFFALILLRNSNGEKRQLFILNIYDRIYRDEEILAILYAVDKNIGLERLKEKLELKNQNEVPLERETDKLFRFLDFIGNLLKTGKLKKIDLLPFSYEIKLILKDETMKKYFSHSNDTGVQLKGVEHLKEKFL